MASSSEEDAAIVAAVCAVVNEEEQQQQKTKKSKKSRSLWVRPWLQRRTEKGAYACILRELAAEDTQSFREFVRMDVERFHDLLRKVAPLIKKQDTVMREAIPPGERLALTLRYLASGNRYRDLQYLYRIPPCTISRIIIETCKAIYSVLRDDHLKPPRTENDWLEIAKGFERRWQFPNCIGALDGKHIAVKAPAGEGSAFFNYKNFHSIILLALVDSNCKFIYVDVGANGRSGDARVFKESALFKRLETKSLKVPASKTICGISKPLPHVIVADDAFPLKTYLLKPYPERAEGDDGERRRKRIFNYRLSRARRCSENAFGILSQRFGVFSTTILLSPEKATVVTQAALCLHNFLVEENDRAYLSNTHTETPDNMWTSRPTLCHQGGNRNGDDARAVREDYKVYFNGRGSVPWQDDLIDK